VTHPRDAAPAPQDRWLTGDGIRLHALDWGGPEAGTLVLLLHGVGGNAWIWADVAPALAAGLPDHHVVSLDQRDGGDSDHPPEGYERDRFVADVLAVQDALGGRPMVLVGHSRGGWLASWLAASHPERVERLVLVDPARLVFATAEDAEGFFSWVRGSLGPFAGPDAAIAWAQAQDEAALWTPTRIRSFLAGPARGADDGRLVGKLPLNVVPLLRQAREGGGVVTEALHRVTMPALVLVAEHQSTARMADKLEYAERIPHARVVRLPGSHFLHTDVPDAVSAAILEFVRG
jgi:pimeloyl-ACP methyl ester carboxylesterase